MSLQKKLNEYMTKALCNYDLPGLAIGAWRRASEFREEFSYAAAAGYFDLPRREALKPEHIFHMASVTKLFVGTAIMQLVERGLVEPDRRLTDYLPWFTMRDERFQDITVRHLLTHTAGLGDVEDYSWDRPRIDSGALRRYVSSDYVRDLPMLWSPSEGKFQYSNIGYEILGVLIEEVSGENFDEYVTERLLKPLQMTDSTTRTWLRTQAGRAVDAETADQEAVRKTLDLEALNRAGVCTPHGKDAENFIVREAFFPYNREHGPSSTLTSSLADVRKWGDAHLAGTMLRPESYREAWRAYAAVPNNGEHIGLSWFIREQEGYTLYGHEGTDDGFRSSFWICPDLDVQLTVLSNISRAPVKKINKQVFSYLVEEMGL